MSPTLAVALLQLRAFDLADHEQAWTELLRRIDDAAAETPRLIVAPESAYPAAILRSREAYATTAVRGDAEVHRKLGEHGVSTHSSSPRAVWSGVRAGIAAGSVTADGKRISPGRG